MEHQNEGEVRTGVGNSARRRSDLLIHVNLVSGLFFIWLIDLISALQLVTMPKLIPRQCQSDRDQLVIDWPPKRIGMITKKVWRIFRLRFGNSLTRLLRRNWTGWCDKNQRRERKPAFKIQTIEVFMKMILRENLTLSHGNRTRNKLDEVQRQIKSKIYGSSWYAIFQFSNYTCQYIDQKILMI